jgi:ParB-like chromosome segregation protein Spo0J
MPDLIKWTTTQMKLGELIDWPENPRQLSEHDFEQIKRSIERFGFVDPLVVNKSGDLIGGHQRKRVLLAGGATEETLVDVRIPDRQLTKKEAEELGVRLNKNTGDWDFDMLANVFEVDTLLEWGFTEYELQIGEVIIPDFQPVDESEQPRLDQKKPVICPECGHEFWPG